MVCWNHKIPWIVLFSLLINTKFSVLLLIHSLKVFPTSISWWSFIGVWVTENLLNILAILNNAVVWMVLIFPLISNYSSPLSKALRTIPNILTTISITISFFSSLTRLKYLSDFLLSPIFTLWSCRYYHFNL